MRAATQLISGIALALGLVACQSGDVQGDYSADDNGVGVASDSLTADLPQAADFTLLDTEGNSFTLSEVLGQDKLVVLEWFNPDCPFVKAYHQGNTRMVDSYMALGGAEDVVWLAINSGAPGKQGAGLQRNQQAVVDYALPYPVLLDETGEVGKAYAAKTTPHMFVIAPDGGILYSGAIDDSAGRGEATSNLVMAAIADHEAGRPVATPASKPFGCSVKYAN